MLGEAAACATSLASAGAPDADRVASADGPCIRAYVRWRMVPCVALQVLVAERRDFFFSRKSERACRDPYERPLWLCCTSNYCFFV